MKIKYLLVLLLVVVSFYFTDKVMIYINNKNPIMKEIVTVKDDYTVEYVNAVIEDNTIIPGVNGKEVDVDKSFNKMENYGYFNDLYLIYTATSPKMSLNDNKDKIIIKGNSKKNMVAFIVDHNDEVINYFKDNNIKFTLVGKVGDVFDKENTYINGETDEKLFSNLNSILNRKKINSNICLVGSSNLELCKRKKYYLLQYSINMNENIIDNINKVGSGDIIYISQNTSLSNVKKIINEISRIDLKIDYLNILISEKN